MWNRIKNAWLVLTGRAYVIPYATIYQDYLHWQESGAKIVTWSEMQDPTSWNPTRQKDGAASNQTNNSGVEE